jgi:hypothetical protein
MQNCRFLVGIGIEINKNNNIEINVVFYKKNKKIPLTQKRFLELISDAVISVVSFQLQKQILRSY